MHLQNKPYNNKIIVHISFILYIMLCSVVYIRTFDIEIFHRKPLIILYVSTA